jgi:hypothetical protein
VKAKAHRDGFWTRDHEISLVVGMSLAKGEAGGEGGDSKSEMAYHVFATSLLMSFGSAKARNPASVANLT